MNCSPKDPVILKYYGHSNSLWWWQNTTTVVKHYGRVSETPCFPGGKFTGDLHKQWITTAIVNYYVVVPKGPKIEKFQSCLIFPISLEIFNLDWNFQSWPSEFPTENRGLVGALAWKFQSCLKISIPEGDLEFFQSLALRGIFSMAGSFGKGGGSKEGVSNCWRAGFSSWRNPILWGNSY